MSKKIGLLGGSGFLGKSLARALQVYSPVLVDIQEPENDEFEFRFCNLLDRDSLRTATQNLDILINLTGQVEKPFENCLRLNSEGILNLALVLRSQQKLLQISTVAVHGSSEFCNAESPLRPETPYGAAKACAELTAQRMISSNQLRILRLPNLYGDHQQKGVVAYLLRSFRSDKKLEFDNDGSLLRYYLHTDDAARFIVECILNFEKCPFKMIAPGEGPLTVKEIIALGEKRLNTKFFPQFEERKPPDNIQQLEPSQNFQFQLERQMGDYLNLAGGSENVYSN